MASGSTAGRCSEAAELDPVVGGSAGGGVGVVRAVRARRGSIGRRREGYPTRAPAFVDETGVIEVGRYDPEERRVFVDDEHALMRWLDTEEFSAGELRASGP